MEQLKQLREKFIEEATELNELKQRGTPQEQAKYAAQWEQMSTVILAVEDKIAFLEG